MGYGTPRDVQFDGGHKFYYAIGDTVDRESMTGVGAFELDLQNADLAEAKLIGQLLCGKNAQSESLKTFEPSASFSVMCAEAGKIVTKYESIQLIPDDIGAKMADIWTRLSDKAMKEGVKIVKLDYAVDKVEHTN